MKSRSTCELWVEKLVATVPGLRALFDKHLADYDEVLPHVFLGDVSRYVVRGFAGGADEQLLGSSRRKATDVLQVLEEALATRDPDLRELVVVSFIENIDLKTPVGSLIHSTMGPLLREEVSRREV